MSLEIQAGIHQTHVIRGAFKAEGTTGERQCSHDENHRRNSRWQRAFKTMHKSLAFIQVAMGRH